MTEAFVALDLPETELLRAIAEEGALTDRDLDELEDRLLHGSLEAAQRTALALTLARAGRASSGWALASSRSQLRAEGRALEAHLLTLAMELLAVPPSPRIDRAESGYRFTVPGEDVSLYVEDPVAAHWHRLGRWGPPIRPDPSRAPRVARAGETEALAEELDTGGTVLVSFAPSRWRARAEPALRLVRAGLSRDPLLSISVRWSKVRSVGVVVRRGERRVAFELGDEPLVVLPPRPSIPPDELLALIARLVERARR